MFVTGTEFWDDLVLLLLSSATNSVAKEGN